MERADPLEGVVRNPGDAHVSHLGVNKPVDEPSARHHPRADAGADGDVDEVVETCRRPPPLLAQRRGVHVGVEGDGKSRESAAHCSEDIGISPTRLGRRSDEPVCGRRGIKVHRAERADADGVQQSPARLLLAEPARHGEKCGGGVAPGGEDGPAQIARSGPRGADDLRPPGLDSPDKRMFMHYSGFLPPALPSPVQWSSPCPSESPRGPARTPWRHPALPQ